MEGITQMIMFLNCQTALGINCDRAAPGGYRELTVQNRHTPHTHSNTITELEKTASRASENV